MKKEHNFLIRGIGIGVTVTSLLFYCVITFSVPKNAGLTNEEIIEKAKGLGMIFISELQNNQPTPTIQPTVTEPPLENDEEN